ncbi:NosD domain-containing protein [Methanococcoides seepicolus]|uniref:PGF-pre-PGF domain-containing protein n=1 Tax=Methanococcoides seepicolus TaxID=2828780 RepID=A0A9E4ZF07_9EURY|nr:NosD domain-containing protein [Methanococcoides seepicolus]MCM1986886.1 PGF-pre-PGF domain-containing protein [Methanococcoides seepicolus]
MVTTATVAADTIYVEGPVYNGTDLHDIVSLDNSDFVEMNASNFAGFIQGESLRIYGGDFVLGRTIQEEGLVYETRIEQAEYESSAWEGETYPIMGFFGNEYVPLKDNPDKIATLLIDNDEEHTFNVGEVLYLGSGYALVFKQVDVEGDKVWMEFSKDGEFIDDHVITVPPEGATWVFDTDVAYEEDVEIMRVHVTTLDLNNNSVVIKGLWLIDADNVLEIDNGDEFGVFEVWSTSTGGGLTLKNGDSIFLTRDSMQEIAEDLMFKVVDSDDLTFNLIKEYVEPREPKTITVDDDGGFDYTTIKDAVNNAINGDIILVYSGNYTENVTVDKQLTIKSQSGNPDDTIIQAGDSSSHIFYVPVDNVTISGFTFKGATKDSIAGIYLHGVNNNVLTNNKLSNNYYGISLYCSTNNTLRNNTMSNNIYNFGAYSYSFTCNMNNDIDTSNSVDGKLIYYLVNVSDVVIDSSSNAGTVYCISCQNVSINDLSLENNHYGIRLYDTNNLIIDNNTVSNNVYGIFQGISRNNMLSNNTVSDNNYGAFLFDSNNNTLINNNVNLNKENGIDFWKSNNNTLINNNVNSNEKSGIYLSYSSNNMLNNNTANANNAFGIYLRDSSNNNTLTSNTVSNNYDDGIALSSSSYNNLNNNTASNNTYIGIRLWDSSDNTLNDNTANSNNASGIRMMNSSYNTLTDNTASNNAAGIMISVDSNDNLIYNNYFNNTNNVEYDGTNTGNNIWNITQTVGTNIVGGPLLGGNYWVHPNGTGFSVDTADSNKDGICDEQYNLSETEFDYLPLSIVVDNLMPVISITSPADGSSTTASSIAVSGLVNGTGSLPVVTVNDIVAEPTILNFSGTFTAMVPLVMGTNTIYANVTDAAGNTNTTPVNVTRTSSGSNGGGGGGGSGATSEAFENIALKNVKTEDIVGGLAISYIFDEEQNAIQYINFSALRNYGRVSTTIEVLKNRSAMVDESAPGVVYSNLNIWVGRAGFATEDNIADPVIGFSVAKEWLIGNGIDENSITLYRHNEGKWNALNTMKIGEDDSYIYFEAETPGFSPFAIAGEVDDGTVTDNTISDDELSNPGDDTESVEEDIPTAESNDIPGFSIFTSVFVLVFACLSQKRKN